jgi:DNA recombination protein RmuC
MLTTIVVGVVMLVAGITLGWFLSGTRVRRAELERENAIARLQHIEATRSDMTNTFAALAQQAFKSVGENLVQMSKTQIDGSLDTKKAEIETMLTPLRTMLDQYRTEVVRSEKSRNEAYGGLQEQIRALLTAQQSAHKEASRLANALQSPTVRGSWGENTLRRCVELAGMSEYCDFETQETFFSEEGKRLRPDLIVRLPNKRVIAIDAKVPLSEYTLAANETDETRKAEFLAQHARQLRRHVDTLSRRDYQASIGQSIDFTVMFLPAEHFLSAALTSDLTLFDYAAGKSVFIATPMILLPLLRAVEASWKAERTEENAKKMHDAGVELFTRFVKVMELFSDLGTSLGKTVEKYNGVIRSIDARLWPKGEEMQRMAGSGKELAHLEQIEAVPLESSRLRLTMQSDEPGDLINFVEK